LNTRTAPELIPDERIRRLRDAITTDPTMPIRLAIVAPGGHGKTTVLGELAAVYRAAGVRTAGGAELLDTASGLRGVVLLVDDVHALDRAALVRLRELAAADRARVIIAARPWPARLGELAGVLGGTTTLRPFDRAQVAARLAAVSRPGLDELVLSQTGGVPAYVDRVVRAFDRAGPEAPLEVPAAAIGELAAELDGLSGDVLTFLLAVDAGAGLHVDLLADLLGREREAVGEVAKAARATGMIDPGGLIPLVRQAIRTLVPVDRRTAVRQRLTDAQLRLGPGWAESVSLAGDLDTALRAADQILAASDAPGHKEAARVAAAALAHRGQLARSAELFRWSGGALSGAFAVIGLIGTAQPFETAVAESTSDSPPTLLSGAAALIAAGLRASVAAEPEADALTSLVRAASLLEPAGAGMLLPDSPAALAALLAVHSGELTVAESVLQRAVAAGMGGVPFAVRHRLLQAWVCMVRGDLAATHELLRDALAARPAGSPLSPRDWLFAVALEVGLARRSSDLSALRRVWAQAGEAVIRHPIDLYTLLPLGELAIAAARLGDSDRLAGHLAEAELLLRQHGDPALWANPLHWSRVQAAIIAERWADAEAAVTALAEHAGQSRYHGVLAAAARSWLSVLRGEVDAEGVEAVARELHAVGLRWDAARLAGQAAIRTSDRKAMVGLMECARLLQGDSPAPEAATDPDATGTGKLSEREQQVARLVLSGLTYREVGDRLFISAKTVEHHVARMRQRLGSGNRRELLAQLRELLG
jgi:DNA-binding CsgD family transcriptional regulator